MTTFNGETLIITLDAPTSGALSQDVQQDWYKEWKLWALNGNLRYPPAFDDNFGGNTLTTAIDAGAYFVFRNDKGWRIKPYEANHTIYVAGNLAPADSLLPVTIPTTGAYTVMFAGLQPVTQNVDRILDEATAANVTINQSAETSKRLIEGLRPHHKGYGDVFYWDPVNGSNSNDGLTPATACLTFAYVHDNLVSNFGHDVVMITTSSTTAFIITETISITKNWMFLRGAGFNTRFKPTTVPASKAVITIDAEGVQITGFHVDLINCADPDSICIKKTGQYFHMADVIVKRAAKQGFLSINGHDEVIEDCMFAYCGTDGMDITNVGVGSEAEDITIKNCHFDENTGSGINITGTAVHEVIVRGETLLHQNGQYGLKIGAGAAKTHIFPDVVFRDNVVGEISDSGTNTKDSRYVTTLPTATWSKVIEGLTAEQIMRVTLAALAGKRQGLGGATEEYLAQDDITPRITFSPDSNGNGTPVLNYV